MYAQSPITAVANATSAKYVPNKLVIKFRANSDFGSAWLRAGRTGEVPTLKRFVGNHTTEPFVDDGLLQGVKRFVADHTEQDPKAFVEGITRICVVNVASTLDILGTARKLSSLRDVEYAEPMNQQTLTDKPNDPFVGSQGHLSLIHAFEAWDEVKKFKKDSSAVIVAIVDTGIDYDHEDLAANMFTNAGEMGTDAQGRDKRSNGVDDDNNGKVDDWHGWDFIGADGTMADNDPKPGHRHGTHVGGIAGAVTNNALGAAGVAGDVPRLRLLPIKISTDTPSRNVDKGFQAILYAASMGAHVINCSWSVTGSANAEHELVKMALAMGSIITAAAGNDGTNEENYPASYPGVLSVASVDNFDYKSGFSNFHASVGIAAPGQSVFATFPGNLYGADNGTSMSSPVVAGVAALVKMRFPSMTGEQIMAQLQATADNIDSLNSDYIGLIGTGRVNAFNAVSITNAARMKLSRTAVQDASGNGFLESGESVEIILTVKNLLASVTNARAVITTPTLSGQNAPKITTPSIALGSFATNEERTITTRLALTMPVNASENFSLPLVVSFVDGSGKILGNETITLLVNPSFKTVAANNITSTLNSTGSIGFNDYPANKQGDGFSYRGSPNLLYEGALMIASGKDSLSNVARLNSRANDRDFVSSTLLTVSMAQSGNILTATARFHDRNLNNQAGVSVEQTISQSTTTEAQDFIITSYAVTNTSNRDFSALYVGLYFDWDIGDDYDKNQTFFDDQCNCAIAQSKADLTQPFIGMKLLTPQKVNFYALDNSNAPDSTIATENGFARSDKWKALSSGIGRKRSSITDIADVIGAGPMQLSRGQTTIVSFAILAGRSLEELRTIAQTAQYRGAPNLTVLPNPANDVATFEYELSKEQNITLDVVNMLGQVVATPFVGTASLGKQQTRLNAARLGAGMYFVRLRSAEKNEFVPFIINR